MKKAILIVEDNKAIREIIGEFLAVLIETDGVTIFKTGKEREAGKILNSEDVFLLITDINLGDDGDGLSLVDTIKQNSKKPYIIAISSIEWIGRVGTYLEKGIVNSFLSKPFSYKDLQGKLMDSKVVKLKENFRSFQFGS